MPSVIVVGMESTEATIENPAGEPYLASHDPQRVVTVLADAPRTGGAMCVVVRDLVAGELHGWCRHTAEDVGYLVVDGTVELRVDDQVLTAEPVSLAFVPRGTPHGYRALTDARVVVLALPAGLERFLESSGPAAAVDAALLLALAQEHHVEMLPDFLS